MFTAISLALAAAMPLAAAPDVQPASDVVHVASEVHKLSADSTVAELLASPEARAVLERHIPKQLARPELELAKPMKLRTVAGYRMAGISAETLQAIEDDLSKL